MRASFLFMVLAWTLATGLAAAQQSVPPAPKAPDSSVVIGETEFKQKACMNKPDGAYCGVGTNRQLAYQCMAGQVVHQTPCPGGCDPKTLACKTEFGVKGIDPPKPQ